MRASSLLHRFKALPELASLLVLATVGATLGWMVNKVVESNPRLRCRPLLPLLQN